VALRESGDRLVYQLMEQDGSANFNMRRGSIRLWLNPDWDSGTGPGYFTQLLGSGIKTVDNTKLWWSLYFNPDGTRLNLEVWDGAGTKKYYWGAPMSLEAGQWYEIVVTFAEDAVRCYVNAAQMAANLEGMTVYPGVDALKLENEFRMASDEGGVRPVRGMISEVEFFNSSLSPAEIIANYNADGDILPDRWEQQIIDAGLGDVNGDGTVDVADVLAGDDFDGDLLTNEEEFQQGRNPHVFDDIIAPEPGVIEYSMNTTEGAYLQWSAATDFYGIETYQILVDGVSVYETTSTQAAITGLLSGTEYQLSVKAIDPSGNEAVYDPVTLTTAAEPAVPAPWQVQRIGQPGTVQNSIAYDAVADRYNIVAGFGFIAGKSDQYYSLHRQASGDFELSVNLELWQSDNDNAYAGLVVRESLSPKAVRFAYLGISDREARVSYRHVEAAESSTVSVAGVQAPAWIRIVRKGNLFSAYSSEDGEKWLLGHSRYVEMSEDVYVGFGAASKMEVSGAVFSHLSLKLMSDSDGDGVSDEEELTNGTDPDKKDTDGDGFSDYDEIYKLFSDPLKKDLGKTEVLQELAASAYSNLSGNWQTVGDTVNSRETRGTLDYEINVRKDGVYLVEVEFASLKNPRGNPIHRLVVSLAGSQLGTINKLLDEGETGVGYVVTPWLNKGKHHVSILWDNVRHDKTIKIKSVRLVKVDGKDKDKNKIPDWVDHRLESGNGADLSAEFSYVSPYCLEGKARFVNGLTITADKKKEIKVYPAPNSGWYADVPLDAKDSTAIKIQFENKAYHEKHKIKWESLNLLEMEELEAGQLYQDAEGVFRLREGDSLNLTASKKVKKEKPAKDPVQIEVILWEDGVPGEPVTYREKEKKAVIHQFMQPGLYTVTGTYLLKDKQDKKITRKIDKVQQDLDEELLEEMPKDKKIKKLKKELQKLLDKLNDSIDPDELEQTIMVQVSGDYFTESPVVELGRFRQWNNPEIGSPVSLEFGDTVQWEDVTSENDQGTQLELAIETLEPAHGVVRIAENEAILDHVEVRPLEIYSGWEVLFRVAEKYADGSDVIEMGVVLSEVYPDVQIEFRMIIGGVVFEDGSTNLILGPDDFDEQGRATIKFLRPGTVDLTVCHQMYVLQNGKRITEK
ncbi:MAG: LamG-like jellyroll fold domain-containing protein, partial [Verrucomicrobiota bacterium]